jgi:PAS domain S-box-containing protein
MGTTIINTSIAKTDFINSIIKRIIPKGLFFILLLLVCIVEGLIMPMLNDLHPMQNWQRDILDMILLLTFIFPLIYFYSYLPLKIKIKKLRQSELLLRESENKFKIIFTKSSANKLLIDPETYYITDANQAALDFYGYSIDEITKLKISQIISLSNETFDHQMSNLKKNKNGEYEFIHRLSSGELRNVKVHTSVIDSAGKVMIYSIILDITEEINQRKEIIQKKEELEKINLELDNFVYSISHDLRSPILSIKGLAKLVLQSKDLNLENRHFLDMIMTSASRQDNTIQEILEYARNSRVNVSNTEFDFVEMVQTIFDDLKFSTECETKLFIHPATKTIINSDQLRINVLLKNLIGNSIKYSQKHSDSWVKVNFESKQNNYLITIQDNGEGISKKHLDRVFEMFYRATTNSVGTGLGLYICKDIIKKLGGEIGIESEPGVGTTITFQISNLN